MFDQKSVEGSPERAADRGRPDAGLVDAARDFERSLGNPEVVQRVVQKFGEGIVELIGMRRDGHMEAEELAAQIRTLCQSCGAVFMGEDPAYLPVPGWNDRRLAMNIMVLLGGDAVRAAPSPAAALLEWFARQIMAADQSDDPDIGKKLQASAASVMDTFIGTPA